MLKASKHWNNLPQSIKFQKGLTYNAAGQSYFNIPRKCIWIGQSVIDPIVWEYAKTQHRKFLSDDKHKLFRQLDDEHKIWNKKEIVCVDKIRKI